MLKGLQNPLLKASITVAEHSTMEAAACVSHLFYRVRRSRCARKSRYTSSSTQYLPTEWFRVLARLSELPTTLRKR